MQTRCTFAQKWTYGTLLPARLRVRGEQCFSCQVLRQRDNQGRFNLESIPPGDYKLFAWQAMERSSYLDPEFLQQFEELGKAVSLKEGASMSVHLDAIPAE